MARRHLGVRAESVSPASVPAIRWARIPTVGGFASGPINNSVEMYDSANGTWIPTNSLTTARYLQMATITVCATTSPLEWLPHPVPPLATPPDHG